MTTKTYVVYRSRPYGPVASFDTLREAIAFGHANKLGKCEYGKGWHVESYPAKTAQQLIDSYVPGTDGGYRNPDKGTFWSCFAKRLKRMLGFKP
jgi:hypothetical protein